MKTSPLELEVPKQWRGPLLALVVLLIAILALYAHTGRGMVAIWSVSDTYAHGFVVPFITLWLIWRIRHSLAVHVPRPSPSAWILMLGAAALWLAGDLVAVNAVTHFSLVLLLVLAVPSILGWSVAVAMAFPLGFLFFAVPIGDFMLPYFMEWTADFTVLALRATGVPDDSGDKAFDDERSEFMGYLKLWKWIHDARGGEPHARSDVKSSASMPSGQKTMDRFVPRDDRSSVMASQARHSGSPLPIMASEAPQTEAIDDEPLDSRISDTTRTTYGNFSISGITALTPRRARLPWPISRRFGPDIMPVSPTENGGKL